MTKKMENNFKYLSEKLSGYCIFIDNKHKLLLIAPQKCGSTSILKALHDRLIEPSEDYQKTFSHEYTKELCIHSHLKSIQDSTPNNLHRIFADQNYQKILVTRDPIDRLCSSICSKYLLESSPFYQREIKQKRTKNRPLLHPYATPEDFLQDFNEIASILVQKGTVFKNEIASHAAPISELIPKQILPLFNQIIDISKKGGWLKLKNSINNHLRKSTEKAYIDNFPHINENPLSESSRFLSDDNFRIACERYSEDYLLFELESRHLSEHQQRPPSKSELKEINTFISLATRSVDLFNIGADTLKKEFKERSKKQRNQLSNAIIKNKQLVIREELSRRTAEHLLIESIETRALLRSSEEVVITKLTNYFPLYRETSHLSASQIAFKAETRIKKKRFRSARELLIQAYCMDKSNFHLLLRLFAVSNKNKVLRTLLLLMTFASKKRILAHTEDFK